MSYDQHTKAFKDRWPRDKIPPLHDPAYRTYVEESNIDCMEILCIPERIDAIADHFNVSYEIATGMFQAYLLLSIFTELGKR